MGIATAVTAEHMLWIELIACTIVDATATVAATLCFALSTQLR